MSWLDELEMAFYSLCIGVFVGCIAGIYFGTGIGIAVGILVFFTAGFNLSW